MQALSVIKRALRALGVIASGEAPDADMSADALESLNDMFAEWRGANVMVPDYAVASISAELSIDAADKEAVALSLADRIGGEYGAELSPTDKMNLETSMHRLRHRYFVVGKADFSELPSGTGDRVIYEA